MYQLELSDVQRTEILTVCAWLNQKFAFEIVALKYVSVLCSHGLFLFNHSRVLFRE